MRALTDIMKEAEDCLGAFLQGEIGEDEWLEAGGREYCLIAGKRKGAAEWSVDSGTLLPRAKVWHGAETYALMLERTPCPGAVLYGWRCPDAFGISDDLDFSCACRGKIIFP